MDICRFCLSTAKSNKDVTELQVPNGLYHRSFIDVLLFCMDHQITEYSEVTKAFCRKCYKKILCFYKFKWSALKNYKYLMTLHQETQVKNEDYLKLDITSAEPLIEEFCLSPKVKEESEKNNDEHREEYVSDDESLSVIKKIKDENVTEETRANAPHKNMGRPKVPKNNVECEKCGKTVRSLEFHMKKHKQLQDPKRYNCRECDREFGTYGAWYKHKKYKHVDVAIKQRCNICNKDLLNLKKHQLYKHNSTALPFECPSCTRRFISRSALKTHSSIHTKDRPHECSVCGKTFRLKLHLQTHQRSVHDQEKPHLCQFCSKSFFKKMCLQIHLRTHTNEKPHSCPECGKTFATTSSLRKHRLVHSNVRPHQCSICNAAFSRLGYLQSHMLSHTKEKRYACQYCGVRFYRNEHRKRHEFTAHGAAHEKHLQAHADRNHAAASTETV